MKLSNILVNIEKFNILTNSNIIVNPYNIGDTLKQVLDIIVVNPNIILDNVWDYESTVKFMLVTTFDHITDENLKQILSRLISEQENIDFADRVTEDGDFNIILEEENVDIAYINKFLFYVIVTQGLGQGFNVDDMFTDYVTENGDQFFSTDAAKKLESCLEVIMTYCTHNDIDIYDLGMTIIYENFNTNDNIDVDDSDNNTLSSRIYKVLATIDPAKYVSLNNNELISLVNNLREIDGLTIYVNEDGNVDWDAPEGIDINEAELLNELLHNSNNTDTIISLNLIDEFNKFVNSSNATLILDGAQLRIDIKYVDEDELWVEFYQNNIFLGDCTVTTNCDNDVFNIVSIDWELTEYEEQIDPEGKLYFNDEFSSALEEVYNENI